MSLILRFLKIIFVCTVLSSLGILGYFVSWQEQEINKLKNKSGGLVMADVENLVDEKIAAIKFPSPTVATTPPQIITKIVNNKIVTPAKSQEFIIPLGSGQTGQTDQWVDIYAAQATIIKENYPSLKQAYFEAVMHVPNAQGELKARLYETTMPFVYGDYLKTQSGTGQFVSIPMILQSGTRTYRVQINNQIGTGVLDSARIRIVTE